MDEFSRAEKHYRYDSVNGPRGAIKRCLRKFGDSASVFERWVGLLPAGDYGSGICGMRHYMSFLHFEWLTRGTGAFKLVLGVGVMDLLTRSRLLS